MEIILSHAGIDFDGLAAMVAAKKLNPKAKMVLAGKADATVREFLSLYKDTFPFITAKQVGRRDLEKVIVVDTNSPERLGEMKWALERAREIQVYDHHPQQEITNAAMVKAETIGAVTTLLVEELLAKSVDISAFEATLFALGIYQDTGSLTHVGTTVRDIRAAAAMVERGANLAIVGEFIEPSLSEKQQALLNQLLNNTKDMLVNGIFVSLTRGKVDRYVGGLAYLTGKLLELTGANTVLSVVQMGKRVHLVGRTRLDCVHMGDIMEKFGGGGHPKAAAATVKDGQVDSIYRQVEKLLEEMVVPLVTAKDIMSYPVKLLSPDTSIKEAGRLMLRYGHTGMPVDDGGKLVGMVSRRDVDKALHHGLGHAPVKGFMSREVQVIREDSPLAEIQRMMVEHDVGRLPVLAGEQVVGIVSRSDLLRTLHGESYDHPFNTLYLNYCSLGTVPKMSQLMTRQLEQEQLQLLAGIGRLADEHKWGVYLVGGLVRDLLLGMPNLDFDLVVEGDAPRLAAAVAEAFGGRLKVHDKFQTATVVLPTGLKLDFATARKEFYEYPAALPTVEASSLREDLYRRDFTINAMAVKLNESDFGALVDFFCGFSDLEAGRIRVLHNLSFIEDPTRILRAVRFQRRFAFRLEPQTAYVLKNAVTEEALKNASPDRVWAELKLMCNQAEPVKIFKLLAQLKLWPQIIPGLEWNASLEGTLEKAESILCRFDAQLDMQLDKHLLYLILLLEGVAEDAAGRWLDQLSLAREQRQLIAKCLHCKLLEVIRQIQIGEPTLGYLHTLLHNCSPVEVAFAICRISCPGTEERLYTYLDRRSNLGRSMKVSGDILLQMGVEPGPVYSQVLFDLEQAVLDRAVVGREEQLQFLHRRLEEKGVI